jgi:glycerate-2-kinase
VSAVTTDVLGIARAGVDSCEAGQLTRRALTGEAGRRLAEARTVHLIAVGKAAASMAWAVAGAAGPRLVGGLQVTPGAPAVAAPSGVATAVGDHPVPGPASVEAGAALYDYLSATAFNPDDLVVFAVSGGASALVARPAAPLTPADAADLHRRLILSGLDITQVNAVRAAVSTLHGGALVRLAQPAIVLGLILCDNVQVGPEAVGSAMTYPGFVDGAVARGVLRQVPMPEGLADRVGQALRDRVGHPPAADVSNVVVGGPGEALRACLTEARQRGYRCVSLGDRLQGEARDVAVYLESTLRTHKRLHPGRPLCITGTGEVAVTVRGAGTGGRCQELAYAMSWHLRPHPGACFVALASDGQDYIPGVMGAWVDDRSFHRLGLSTARWRDTLDRNDTHRPLATSGHCIPAEATDTNVCDVYVLCQDAR